MFLDTDGSMLNAETLSQDVLDAAEFPLGVPNTTLHSAIMNDMFRDMPEVRCVGWSDAVGLLCVANAHCRGGLLLVAFGVLWAGLRHRGRRLSRADVSPTAQDVCQ